jgi:hypothetical protein
LGNSRTHLNGIPNGGATAAQPLVIVPMMMMMMGVGVEPRIGTVRIVDDDHLLRFRNRCSAADDMAMTDMQAGADVGLAVAVVAGIDVETAAAAAGGVGWRVLLLAAVVRYRLAGQRVAQLGVA